MTMAGPSLIFVYNADGGVRNGLKDMVHKIVSPSTYPCSLCALTHGWFTMRPRWRRSLKSLPQPKRFLHRDEFARQYPGMAVALPAVLLAEGTAPPQVLISAAELDRLPDLADLIALVEARLAVTRIGAPISPLATPD